MKCDYRDVAIRAAKTFVEAVIAFVMAEIAGTELFEMDAGMWAAIAISAAAAGVSAVWNGVLEPMIRPVMDRNG